MVFSHTWFALILGSISIGSHTTSILLLGGTTLVKTNLQVLHRVRTLGSQGLFDLVRETFLYLPFMGMMPGVIAPRSKSAPQSPTQKSILFGEKVVTQFADSCRERKLFYETFVTGFVTSALEMCGGLLFLLVSSRSLRLRRGVQYW